jgi:hypothetical protein
MIWGRGDSGEVNVPDSIDIEGAVKKWCDQYKKTPITEYSSDKAVFEDGLVYDGEDVQIIRMKGENRTTLSISPPPVVDVSRESYLIERIGYRQWQQLVRKLAALYGPVDVDLFDDGSGRYNLVDYVYDEVFSLDIVHQRIRVLVSAKRLIEAKLESLYDALQGTTSRWLRELP